MNEIRRVGFVGLGNMGRDQVCELVKAPTPLTIYDVSRAAMDRFAGQATLAASMADVGREADIVSLCVQNDTQVSECAENLLPVMKAGSVLMVHSTVKPSTMVRLGDRAIDLGVEVLDASVTRLGAIKDGPFLFCMTGGDEAVAARVQPVLSVFCSDTLHVGPLGSAMALKICNNLASICSVMIGLEAFGLAASVGVPLDKLTTVMKRNGVLTPFAEYVVAASLAPNRGSRASMETMGDISAKDLRLAEALAAEVEAHVPVASLVQRSIQAELRERFAGHPD